MSLKNGKRKRVPGEDVPGNDLANEDLNKHPSSDKEDAHQPEIKQNKRPKQTHGKLSLRQKDLLGGIFTEEVYKSNLFKLQVDELLEQVKPNLQPAEAKINDFLKTIKTIIESTPERSSTSVPMAEKQLQAKKVIIPFPEPRPVLDPNYKVSFNKPSSINVVGSYALKTITAGNANKLDLIVNMPPEMFQEKDYLNHRYFVKRAYYLACIAETLKKKGKDSFTLEYSYLDGNQLLPILVLQTQKKDESLSGWKVQVIPATRQGTFKKERLSLTRNCVRIITTDSDEHDKTPSPFYNGSVMADSLMTYYLKLQHEAIKSCPSFLEASILGRIWLRQRGFKGSINDGGFGSFEWNATMALLLQGGGTNNTPLFSQRYTSYQLFKAMLQFLASRDLSKDPLIIKSSADPMPNKFNGAPILWDGQSGHNVWYKVLPWTYKLLQHDANVSLSALSDQSVDQFYTTFIAKVDQPFCRFDALLETSESTLYSLNQPTLSSEPYPLLHNLYKTLTKALNNRIKLMSIQSQPLASWEISEKANLKNSSSFVVFGFLFNEANMDRTVDRGPSADQVKEASIFRKFWGEKAELRRFKDGSIMESVLWSSGQTSVFQNIVSYILTKHFGASIMENSRVIENAAKGLLTSKPPKNQTENEIFQGAINAIRSLEQNIRELDDMPLHLRQILPSDSKLSFSSVQLPFINTVGQNLVPANAVIQFEGSARWPDDLEAIQRTKVAFLLKLSELLEQTGQELTCRVGLENEGAVFQNRAILDVINSSGSVFRLRIHHDREATLLERVLKGKTSTPLEKVQAATALYAYKKEFIGRPAHTQAIQTLATRYPSFSHAVRLVKHWFNCHRLSCYFDECLIELFVARVYTEPYPWSTPSSPTCGLVRTLNLLGRWDWRSEPWITNLGSEGMSEPEISAITTRFKAWRKIDPAFNRVVMFVASNVDGEGNTWTDNARPSKVIASRMTALARLSVQILKHEGMGYDVGEIFVSSLVEYDFFIKINPDLGDGSLGRSGSGKTKFKNLQLQNATDAEFIGFNPVMQFISELQDIFQESIVLFYNNDSPDIIAGLWVPYADRSWKLKVGYSTMPINQGDKIKLNKAAVLNDLARVGGSLIQRISTKTS